MNLDYFTKTYPLYSRKLISLNYPFKIEELREYKNGLDWFHVLMNQNIVWTPQIKEEFSSLLTLEWFDLINDIPYPTIAGEKELNPFVDRVWTEEELIQNELDIVWGNLVTNQYSSEDDMNVVGIADNELINWSFDFIHKFDCYWNIEKVLSNKESVLNRNNKLWNDTFGKLNLNLREIIN